MPVIGHIGCICLVSLLMAVATVAHSAENAPAPIDLNITWQLSNPCLSEAAMEAGIIRQLGDNWQGDATMPFDIAIQSVNNKWNVNMRIAESGKKALTRTVSVHSCETASRVAVILVLIALAPDRLTSPESLALLETLNTPAPDEPVALEEPAPIAAEAPPAPAENPVKADEEPPKMISVVISPAEWRAEVPPEVDVLLSLQFLTGVGMLPTVGFGASADVALRINQFHLAAAISGLFPASVEMSGTSGGTLTTGSLTAGVFGGVAIALGPIHLTPSIGVDLHTLWAKTSGISQSVEAHTSFAGVRAGIQGDWTLAPFFAIRLAVNLSIPLTRPIFEVEGAGQVHQPSAVLFFTGIGPVFIF